MEEIIKAVFYLGLLLALLILGIISFIKVKTVPEKLDWYLKPFYRMASFCSGIIRGKKIRSAQVSADLVILDPSRNVGAREEQYYIEKLLYIFMFLLFAALLGFGTLLTGKSEKMISPDGQIERNGYGGLSQYVEAEASAAGEGGEMGEIGVFDISVDARKYTDEQCRQMAAQLFEEIPQLILNGNRDLAHVTQDLKLITKADEYPFRISWKSNRNAVLNTYGTVSNEDFTEGQKTETVLTATLTYEDFSEEESFDVCICELEKDPQEKLEESIEAALEGENKASGEDAYFRLPTVVDGITLNWKEIADDDSILLFSLVMTAGIVCFFYRDRQLHAIVEKRSRQLLIDYPQFVSKFALFLGAGLSVRNIFYRMGEEYSKKRQEGGEKQYVYEEVLLLCHELDSGISENAVYSHFGSRCHVRQYTKFCSLLNQNLKKGNQELLLSLQEEADLAMDERKNLARRLGEEASVKLLFPMMMMLGITMAIILIPAFSSFSF